MCGDSGLVIYLLGCQVLTIFDRIHEQDPEHRSEKRTQGPGLARGAGRGEG